MTQGLLVGAYERDNFGDLLFLLETRRNLGDLPTVATAPVAGDMRALLGVQVENYRDYLNRDPVPFMWTVGGETGATSIREAAYMSTTAHDDEPMSPGAAVPEYASPYLPRPSLYRATQGARYVINSVGIAGIAGLTGRHRIETVGALREATFLSVRERDSSRVLKREGIPHQIAPDVVHTLAERHVPTVSPQRDVALIQAKEKNIRAVGVSEFARLIGESAQLKSYRLRLFSAGEARGHDSAALLEEVAAELAANGHGSRVEVSRANTPLSKVDEIATAGIWIGTSLHGYIISTAFGVPRVGLELAKLSRYAKTWSIPYPADAKLGELETAVEASLSIARRVDPMTQAAELGALARKNVVLAREHLELPVDPALLADRQRSHREIADRLLRVTKRSEAWESQARLAIRAMNKASGRASDTLRGLGSGSETWRRH